MFLLSFDQLLSLLILVWNIVECWTVDRGWLIGLGISPT